MSQSERPVFKDHFSATADKYAAHRPSYPPALADRLAALVRRPRRAWDCGCGSGQLSSLLAARFDGVVATDASAEQIAGAPALDNVDYRCARTEASGLAAECADLVVAAQAAHWFDLPAFYAEARRVGRAGAAIALVTYGIMRINADIDPLIGDFYRRVLGDYWPPERRHVEQAYQSLAFPFPAIPVPSLSMELQWSAHELLGYIQTWSAVRKLERACGRSPFEAFEHRLVRAWGNPEGYRRVRWPLTVRAGRLLAINRL